MDTIEIALSVKKNGVAIDGSPFVRRVNVDEMQSCEVERLTSTGYLSLPIDQLDQVQFLLLQADQQIAVRIGGQTTGSLVLNANALLLIIDSAIADTPATNVLVGNVSVNTAVITALAGGT